MLVFTIPEETSAAKQQRIGALCMHYLSAKLVCSATTGRMKACTINNATRNFVVRGLRGNSGHIVLSDQAASAMAYFGVSTKPTTYVGVVSLVLMFDEATKRHQQLNNRSW